MRTLALSKLASSQVLLAVAGVAVAGSALAGSGTMAAFTRTTSNTANTFQAATVNLTTTPNGGSAGGAIFQTTSLTIDKIIPGDSFTRYLTLHNSGDVAADLSLSVTASGTTDAGVNALVDNGAKSLKLYIASCNSDFSTCGTDVYGTSASPGSPLPTDQSIATSLAASGDKYLKVYVALPSSVVDDGTGTSIQGKGTALSFTWKATQNGSGAAR